MKTASAPLLALLASGQYVRADLWTITLSGGAVLRWTSHELPLTWNGNLYSSPGGIAGSSRSPVIQGGTLSEKIGPSTATMDVTITGLADDTINGVPVISFIARHGLDGALVRRDRVYASDWSSSLVGSVNRFAGKVTDVKSIKGAKAQLTVSSWMFLLDTNVPRNLYQAGCLHTLYDNGCGVSALSYRTATSVTGLASAISFATALTPTANYFAQGRVIFTSGANNGLTRTVKSSDTSGFFVLAYPLPTPVSVGDTFGAYAGCDLAQATCAGKFNNLGHFKATPYVPVPTTSLGAAATATTVATGGKGL